MLLHKFLKTDKIHFVNFLYTEFKEFCNKALPQKAPNGEFSPSDFTNVLLEAAQTNAFLEGTCERVDGSCDAETLFNKLQDIEPEKLHDIFFDLVAPQVKKLKNLDRRNRKIVIAADITCDAYYGHEKNEWIHGYCSEKGSTGSYQYMVVSIILNEEKFILGFLPLRTSDEKHAILKKLLLKIRSLVPIEIVLLDRGFVSQDVIKVFQELKRGYLILWRKCAKHRRIFKAMKCKKIHRINNYKIGKVVTDLVFVKGIKIKGDTKTYDWVFATNMVLQKPIHYIYLYRRRWAIETKFRVTDELQIKTKTKNMNKRYFLALFTAMLYNEWKWFTNQLAESKIKTIFPFSTFVNHFANILVGNLLIRAPKPKQAELIKLVKSICF